MVKRISIVLVLLTACIQLWGQCPGYNPNQNNNLACQIVTTVRTPAGSSLQSLSPTLAAQLSQLPIASAVSGSGVLVFTGGVVPTVKGSESLGTILTQRGETVGRHKFYVSFNYQRFNFDTLDGVDLGMLPTVNSATSGATTTYQKANVALGINVDQFTTVASFGVTSRMDVSVIVPFSHVNLYTQQSNATSYFKSNVGGVNVYGNSPISNPFPNGTNGSATGIGDVIADVKVNVFKSSDEHFNIAVGGQVRFPTGDEFNYLGTGAYGIKPYMVLSRAGKRFSPNFNIGYQYNGASALNPDAAGYSKALPSTLNFAGGLDVAITKRLTAVGEYLGNYVINGPRIASTTASIPTSDTASVSAATITTLKESYAMNNIGVGLKFSPIRHLLINASGLFAMDSPGLRAKIVPLVGVSYRF